MQLDTNFHNLISKDNLNSLMISSNEEMQTLKPINLQQHFNADLPISRIENHEAILDSVKSNNREAKTRLLKNTSSLAEIENS